MSELPEYGTIWLDGVAFPVLAGTVGYQSLATFSRKIVSGDPGRDSDDLISSKIWTGFPGGIGVENNRDVADDGKCWYTTVWSRDPFKMTLNRRVVKVAASPAVKYPLGDLAGSFYAATATTVHRATEATTPTFGASIGALSSPPAWRGVAWNGKLYVPCGSAGYHATDGATVDAIVPAVKAIGFVVATDPGVSRLYALCADGTLQSTTDGAVWQTDATLNSSETPRRILIWMDRTEQDTVFVVTDRSVYAWDQTNGYLVRTRMSELPPHPDNGLGAATWRPGEDAYFSFGLQVMQYAAGLSQIAPVGPDRQEGLPNELRGRFVDLAAEFNSVVGLLEGVAVAASAPTSEFDPGHDDEPAEVSGTTALSAVLAYNGFGWHPLWRSGDDSGDATFLCVSGTTDGYRLWWGWGDGLYTIKLSRSFANPRQQFETGEGDFEETGTLDTGWYDGNMREFEKLASAFEVNLDSGSDTETVAVEYDTDWDDDRRLLGVASAKGKTVLPFGVETTADGALFSEGLSFRRIRFWLTWSRTTGDSTQTPVLDSFVLKHIRLPLSGSTYRITVPLALGPEGWGDRTAGEIKQEIDALLVKRGFVRLQHGDHPDHHSHRVRLSYVSGTDRTGDDDRGSREITVVEIPLEGYEGD